MTAHYGNARNLYGKIVKEEDKSVEHSLNATLRGKYKNQKCHDVSLWRGVRNSGVTHI